MSRLDNLKEKLAARQNVLSITIGSVAWSGMMQTLRTKLEQDQVAELINNLVINSSDEAYPKEFKHFQGDVEDYYGAGYDSLDSAFEKMELENYVWPYEV